MKNKNHGDDNVYMSGVTLIELILVISTVIILTAIGTSSYTKSKNRAVQKEGIANIKLMAAAERIYKMEQTVYTACTCTNATNCFDATTTPQGCNAVLKLMLNTTNWNYGVTLDAGGVATITATMLPTGGCSYTFNSADFNAETIGSSGCN